MRVLITGGAGFVGSHTVAAVVRDGHTVRLLARRPERASAALAPLGICVEDIVSGDALDPASVRAAVAGCDALINAAAVYSLDPRKAGTALATNAPATEIVLEAATGQGSTRSFTYQATSRFCQATTCSRRTALSARADPPTPDRRHNRS